MLNYKGYIGHVSFDDEAEIFHGRVINTRDVITFQGDSIASIKQAFQESVDDYLEFCRQRGESPEKPFSGKLNLRLNPQLHRQASYAAAAAGKSLNKFVIQAISQAIQKSQ